MPALTASSCHNFLGCFQISWDDLKDAEAAVGEFGGDNRAGEPGRPLHMDSLQAALLSVHVCQGHHACV